MNPDIVVALIGLLGSAIGSLCGIAISSKLMDYRLGQLEKKVDKHNQLIERTYRIEEHEAVIDEQIRALNHRISDMEGEHNAGRTGSEAL